MEDTNKIANLLEALSLSKEENRSQKVATEKQHKFWSTQPVSQVSENIITEGPIEFKSVEDIKSNPANLPAGFEWFTVDLEDNDQMTNLYELLTKNYVEDTDATFRFDYSPAMLKWALMPPGWQKEWNIGVRVTSSKKMVAFISGIPATMSIRGKEIKLVEINFLCVMKKLRSKRLAPVLIKEVTRMVNLKGIFQAVYTAGIHLPTPFSKVQYFHRTINAKKLAEIGFAYVPPNMTMGKFISSLKLPSKKTLDWVPMEKSDVPIVRQLLAFKFRNLDVFPVFDEDEISHYFLPVSGVLYSYVVRNSEGVATDFLSFYALNSTIARNPSHSHLYAAYLYYFAEREGDSNRKAIVLSDALIIAKENKFDVMNCLNQNANDESLLMKLKYGPGSGYLHYYIFNYKLNDVAKEKLGLVMI